MEITPSPVSNADGDSQEDTTLSTDAALVQRLHTLLETLHIPPPYLLIGHFMGGPAIHRPVSPGGCWPGLYRLRRFYAYQAAEGGTPTNCLPEIPVPTIGQSRL